MQEIIIGTTRCGILYQQRYKPYTGDAGILLHLNEKFTNRNHHFVVKCHEILVKVASNVCIFFIIAYFCQIVMQYTKLLISIHVLIYWQNGALSALPYACAAFMALTAGQIADLLRSRNILTTTQTRRLFQGIGKLIYS